MFSLKGYKRVTHTRRHTQRAQGRPRPPERPQTTYLSARRGPLHPRRNNPDVGLWHPLLTSIYHMVSGRKKDGEGPRRELKGPIVFIMSLSGTPVSVPVPDGELVEESGETY